MSYRGEPPPIPTRAIGRPKRAPGPWLALFAVALALRVAYAWVAAGPSASPASDGATYDTVAWNLAIGSGFSLDGATGPYPTAFVPPVVPWLTSLAYRVVGHHYFAALLLQCVIGALVPLLVAVLGGTLFGSGPGRTAGWLTAFHPLLVFFSGYLLTETAFCLVSLVAFQLSAAWVKTPSSGRAIGAGMAWGAAALTRPTGLPLALVVAAWAWGPLGLTVGSRVRRRQIALLALGLVLVLAPWTARNAMALRAFVPLTTGGGRALLDSNNAANWSDPARRGGGTSVYGEEPWASHLRGLSEPAADARARADAWRFLSSHVPEWPAMALAKLGRFWRLTAEGGGTGSWQRRGSPLRAFLGRVDPLLLWSLLALPLALWGLVRVLRGPRRWFQALPLLGIAALSAVAVVFWGSLRMRVPAEPLVMLYAGLALEDLRLRVRTWRRGFRVVPGGG